MTDVMRGLFRKLPGIIQNPIRGVYARAQRFLPAQRAREAWLTNDYSRFAMGQRETIFLAASRFAHINRPIEGYYFEFGCHGGNTMRMAWKHTNQLHRWTFVGFDSFEGLPEIASEDSQQIWQKGK